MCVYDCVRFMSDFMTIPFEQEALFNVHVYCAINEMDTYIVQCVHSVHGTHHRVLLNL